jgi:hypothetical protein
MPCAGPLLDAAVPAALAFINPRRSNEETHPTPSSPPDIFSSSLSLSFDDACTTGAVLDASRAAALDRRWTNGGWGPEEECCRSLFHPSPSSSASSTHAAVAVVFFSERR